MALRLLPVRAAAARRKGEIVGDDGDLVELMLGAVDSDGSPYSDEVPERGRPLGPSPLLLLRAAQSTAPSEIACPSRCCC